MRIKLILLCLLLAVMSGSTHAQENATYLQRPIVPDSISSFAGRCNYVADHFFDFCDFKKAFSSRAKMGSEIKTYIDVIRNASPERAESAAAHLMEQLRNQPADQLYVASIAEEELYGDTAEVWYDRLYLPFAKAIVANKKIKSAEKARFVRQVKVLENSLVGQPVPALSYVTPAGEKRTLADDNAEVVVVMLSDPGCSDCSMARVRLDADASLRALIKEGRLKMVVIGIADPNDPEWVKKAADMPETWTVGANPDVDMEWDMRISGPALFIYDKRHNLRWKHLMPDQVLDIARQLMKR